MSKITQINIATETGLSQSFVSQVVTGKKRPSWPTAKKLAEATGTETTIWLEGTPEEIREAIKEAAIKKGNEINLTH